MRKKNECRCDVKGFTLIELMIVIVIIAIIASLALPLYQKYIQATANSACMAEAKAYVSGAMALAANGQAADIAAPLNSACATSPTMTVGDYNSASVLTFAPHTKGVLSELKNTDCNAASGSCTLRTP